jgi:TonB family protein
MLTAKFAIAATLLSSAALALATTTDVEKSRLSPNAEFLAKHYPPAAKKRGEQGKVGFKIVVEPDGSLGSCEVTQSSGFQSLDNETCEIIVSYAKLNKIRNTDGRSVRATQVGYIDWRLPEGAKVASATPSGDVRDPERIICKRQAETGSLVRRTKVCHTAKEWAALSRRTNDEVERLMRGGAVEDGKQCAATFANPAGC